LAAAHHFLRLDSSGFWSVWVPAAVLEPASTGFNFNDQLIAYVRPAQVKQRSCFLHQVNNAE